MWKICAGESGLIARAGKPLCTTKMKKYSNGRERRFDPARNRAVNEDDRIVNRETKSGPASLQNRSIRRIVAFMSAVSVHNHKTRTVQINSS